VAAAADNIEIGVMNSEIPATERGSLFFLIIFRHIGQREQKNTYICMMEGALTKNGVLKECFKQT
jgi:UDP-3-O-acyl-N-acetylglucosamine deacetylase